MTKLFVKFKNENPIEIRDQTSFSNYFTIEERNTKAYYSYFEDLKFSFLNGIQFLDFYYESGLITFQAPKRLRISLPADIETVNLVICDPSIFKIDLLKIMCLFYSSRTS